MKMESITYKIENGLLTLFAEGRIDSTSAPDAEKQIEAARTANAHTAVV